MTNSPKPFPPSVMPRQLPRLALAVAAAIAGIGLTSTHAVAQKSMTSLQVCTTYGICTTGRSVAIVSLCWFVAFAAIAGLVSLRKPGRRSRPTNSMVLACAFLVAFIAAGTGAWVVIGSTSTTSTAPGVTGASSQTIQFQ